MKSSQIIWNRQASLHLCFAYYLCKNELIRRCGQNKTTKPYMFVNAYWTRFYKRKQVLALIKFSFDFKVICNKMGHVCRCVPIFATFQT